jgi:hypothetical protein
MRCLLYAIGNVGIRAFAMGCGSGNRDRHAGCAACSFVYSCSFACRP